VNTLKTGRKRASISEVTALCVLYPRGIETYIGKKPTMMKEE
jgi:hypothetical protein